MESYTEIKIIRKLNTVGLSVFTLTDFAKIFRINNRQTVYKKIQRLEKRGMIQKLIKGKYIYLPNKPADFTLANFLYQPSYVSLESALSFYGIITGFTYQITSITNKKAKLYVWGEKSFKYAKVKTEYFWGWEKKENFLIADREKAVLDYLYLAFKGWRIIDRQNLTEDFDFSSLNKRKLKDYIKKFNNLKFSQFVKKII